MAHHVEPMDIDSDFDNKENSLHHNNVLPFTEKGYEELDVSELNMKLRYSVTPASSPMSKSLTNSYVNRTQEAGDDPFYNTVHENTKLTCSLNSTLTKSDSTVSKSLKALPLQCITSEQLVDNNTSVLRGIDSSNNADVTVTVSGPSDLDENLSLPSSSSSTLQTPEATTPTKEIPIKDGGSPIMRGLKTVLNMFRSSQSPIPLTENDNVVKSDILSPVDEAQSTPESKAQLGLASTPISSQKKKEMSPTKRHSPVRDNSIVFKDDLEKELQWKDETTIIFSEERIPIHKLMLQLPQDKKMYKEVTELLEDGTHDINSTVEYMDISYNDSFADKTMTDVTVDKKISQTITESDNEFVDCETTFTEDVSLLNNDINKTPIANQTQEFDSKTHIQNDSGSRLKPIILDTTQDILDATLSVRPEDLLPDYDESINKTIGTLKEETKLEDAVQHASSLQEDQSISDVTTNVTSTTQDILDATLSVKPEDLHSNYDESNNKTIETLKEETKLEDAQQHISSLQEDKSVSDITTNVTSTLAESQPEDQTTKSIDVIDTTQPNNETFDVESPLNNEHNKDKDENLDSTITLIAPLSETMNLDPHEKVSTTTYVHHGSLPSSLASAPEVKTETPMNPETMTTTVTGPTLITEIPLATALNPLDGQSVDNTVKETSMTELPIDIPLPDEEDLDKEFYVGINSIPDSLPIERIDDTKVMTDVNEAAKIQKTDITINETDSSRIVTKIWENTVYSEQEISSVVACVLPEVVTSFVNNDIAVNNTIKQENKKEILDTLQTVDNIDDQHETSLTTISNNKEVESMNINENVSELKPLPDVINQTIAVCNSECLEENHGVPASTESDQVETSQSVIPEVIEQMIAVADNLENVTKSLEIETEARSTTAGSIVASTTQKDMGNLEAPIDLNKEEIMGITKESCLPSAVEEQVSTNSNANTAEEEIVLSENNSPFVSVIADNIDTKPQDDKNTEVLEHPLEVTTKEVTPPNSPPIRSKGYNFNFDDMDFDPFATKTKIRLSPPLESPNKLAESSVQHKTAEKPVQKRDFNRRRSQPERKKPVAPKRKLNSTFDAKITDNVLEGPVEITEIASETNIELGSPPTFALDQNVTIEENKLNQTVEIAQQPNATSKHILKSETEIVLEDKTEQSINKPIEKSNTVLVSSQDEVKTSSSEQSMYYSADSETNIPSKNVFNLPEIDDAMFRPFATKSKLRQSPPLNVENPFTTKNNIQNSPNVSMILPKEIKSFEDKIETEPVMSIKDPRSVDPSEDVNTTGSTSNTHTEDEDTVEGPFFDDLNQDEKILDFDGENDMMQFHELPAQSNEDNLDTGEMFIDAEAFEFLLNQNQCNTVVDSGKESLFLKFDPLFAKRMSAVTSDGVVASLANLQKKQSTPTKVTRSAPSTSSPVAGPSNLNVTQDLDMSEEFNDDLNITVAKPMMVVPPAVNPVTPRNKSLTPNRSNRRSITFTSPAMAVIDRLLSLSGNNSLVHDTTVTQTNREQNEADIALSQLRELLAEKEISVYNLRSESNDLKDRLSSLEGHVKSLEAESESRLKKINELTDTLVEKTKINKSMAAVVEEYERTIASLIAETAQDKKRHADERIKLINERDEQTAHLASMEVSFSDLHSKYEKSKQIILNCKANEETYKKSIKEFEENLAKMQNNYELLKQHATSKLNHANQELEKINRTHEAEVLKLNAMIKRKDLHITSLEESLAQKTKANEELTAICDELINKVG